MKKRILEVCKKGSVSFAELSREVDGFSGNLSFGYGNNIWLWFAISQEGSDAIGDLIKSDEIKLTPTQTMVYMIDGMVPTYPIAKQSREYKEPHWLPVVFNLVQ